MRWIQSLRKGRGYMTLEFSEGTGLRIPMPVYRERRFKPGQPFDEAAYQRLLEERETPHALDDAVRLLSLRARSEREVERYLLGRAYREQAVARVMQRLTQEGYLRDAEFADQYVLSKSARAVGERRLTQELRQKGVDPGLIEQSIAALDREEQSRVAAKHAAKLLQRVRGKTDRERQQKVIAGLLRRGYPLDQAKEALRMAASGELDGDVDFEGWEE